MKTSDSGLGLIKQFEGLKTKAYLCTAGVPTIGYGHTQGVTTGDTCTEQQATDWLKEDVAVAEADVMRLVNVDLTQHQFDALVSFTFNLGAPKLASSTLLTKLNAGNFTAAADQFGRWVFAGDVLQPGLVKRRAAEKALFLS